jgi:thioredoxin 1
MFLYVMGASVVLAIAIAVIAHFRSKAASAPSADSDVDTEEFDGTVGEEFPNPNLPRADLFDLTDENFEAEMAKSDLPIVVEFFADWCSACRTQGPLMEQAAAEFAGKARFYKVDHDVFNTLLHQLSVDRMPTTFFVNPKTRTQIVHVGVLKVDAVGEKLDQLAANSDQGIAIGPDSKHMFLLDAVAS